VSRKWRNWYRNEVDEEIKWVGSRDNFPIFFVFGAVCQIKLALPSASERSKIGHIVSYRIVSSVEITVVRKIKFKKGLQYANDLESHSGSSELPQFEKTYTIHFLLVACSNNVSILHRQTDIVCLHDVSI